MCQSFAQGRIVTELGLVPHIKALGSVHSHLGGLRSIHSPFRVSQLQTVQLVVLVETGASRKQAMVGGRGQKLRRPGDLAACKEAGAKPARCYGRLRVHGLRSWYLQG